MPMQGTYLCWLDLTDTGMELDEIKRRVAHDARLGVTWGPTLGPGGAKAFRVNIGTTRANVTTAAERLCTAFADLQ